MSAGTHLRSDAPGAGGPTARGPTRCCSLTVSSSTSVCRLSRHGMMGGMTNIRVGTRGRTSSSLSPTKSVELVDQNVHRPPALRRKSSTGSPSAATSSKLAPPPPHPRPPGRHVKVSVSRLQHVSRWLPPRAIGHQKNAFTTLLREYVETSGLAQSGRAGLAWSTVRPNLSVWSRRSQQR